VYNGIDAALFRLVEDRFSAARMADGYLAVNRSLLDAEMPRRGGLNAPVRLGDTTGEQVARRSDDLVRQRGSGRWR